MSDTDAPHPRLRRKRRTGDHGGLHQPPPTDRQRQALAAVQPYQYTREVAERVCEMVAQGVPVSKVCGVEPWAPSLATWLRWLQRADNPHPNATSEELGAYEGLRGMYHRAREAAADIYAEQVISISDEAYDSDTAAASRVRVEARKWYAAKLRPRTYGDNLAIGVGGGEGGIVINLGRHSGGEVKDSHRQMQSFALVPAKGGDSDPDS